MATLAVDFLGSEATKGPAAQPARPFIQEED
jgi:hypothetical protein